MSTETVKSTFISNYEATPQVPNKRSFSSMVIHRKGYAAIGASASSGSIYHLVSVPSNAKIVDVRVSAPDIGTTITMDFGLYTTAGVVKDSDAFAAALDLHSGALDNKSISHGVVLTVDLHDNQIWQIAGDSADPGGDYYISGTSAADNDGTAGKVLVNVFFTT